MIDFEVEMRRIAREEAEKLLAEKQAKVGEQLLTTIEAADVARVTPNTIRRWIREGLIVPTHAGTRPRFRRADLDATMAKMSSGRRRVSSNDNASIDDLVEKRFAKKAK